MLHKAISNLKNQDGEGEGGFTLIELLVVILIIGILAAIALPTFLGQSDKAKDSEAKSDVRNAYTQVESCLTDEPLLATCTASLAGGVTALSGGSANSYTLQATSTTGNLFRITKAAPGSTSRSCTNVKTGAGCSATSWGTVVTPTT